MSLQFALIIVLSIILIVLITLLVGLVLRDRRSMQVLICLHPDRRISDMQPLRIAGQPSCPKSPEKSRLLNGPLLNPRPLILRILGRIFCLTPQRILVMSAGSLLMAAFFGFAVNRDNGHLQMLELENYAWVAGLPRQGLQVDLARYHSFSQYTPAIASPQAGNFGQNACGLIAPAQAAVLTANPRRAGTPQGFNAVYTLMTQIRAQANRPGAAPAYQGATGIQPSALVQALRASPIGDHYIITARNSWTLAEMYQALLDGRIVIVDILVRQQDEIPSTTPDTFAHYARVLGIDLVRQQITLDNTLGQQDGKSYWTLSLSDFMAAWDHPETLATIRPSQVDPSIKEENVNHWALVMEKK